jgi:hypothetical protein
VNRRDGNAHASSSDMAHCCQYLCSELVTVTYEDQPGEIRQAAANLEEISSTFAVVLLEERPGLGSPISLDVKGRELFGVITSSLYDAALGWFATVTLDAGSLWHREWFSPEHLFAMCACSREGATRSKAQALETTRNTEEKVPVSFLVSPA